MQCNRRQWLLAASAAAAAALPGQSALAAPATAAAALPPGPIKLVVGFPPGGGTDILARLLAQKLQVLWARTVIVENRAGVSGTLAADYVARQPGDGNTLLLAHISSNGIAPGLYPKLGYSAEKDFAPITMLGATPMVVMCKPDKGLRSLEALIERCRQQPGRVSFGSAGTGSAQHLAMEELRRRAGIEVLHVPYKGSAPMVTDLLGGQIDACFEGMTTATPYLKAGKLQGLATTRLQRAKGFAELPTLAEKGFAGFDASIWFALAAPAAMPAALVQRMNADVNQVLASADLQAKLSEIGAEDSGGTPERLGAFMRAEQARWARLIRDAKITPDS